MQSILKMIKIKEMLYRMYHRIWYKNLLDCFMDENKMILCKYKFMNV